ncbi:MAG: SOS response-associated peptidase [Dokdonia sp.]|jgi:putative SOS response-associated peptidase YedK
MCYDIKASLEAQLHKAKKDNDLQAIEEILEKLIPLTDLPIYHASGFSHPDLLIYTIDSPNFPIVASWGLIPHWVSNQAQKEQLWNKTLNARGASIFDKPSFREAAIGQRAIVYIDGFYEHHHYKNNTYPFFIEASSKQPLAVAALYDEWIDPETNGTYRSFTIVTTQGNALLSKIHNNPKLKGPRMPVLLTPDQEKIWLSSREPSLIKAEIDTLLTQPSSVALKAHTVGKLRGKAYRGNISSISDQVHYPELAQIDFGTIA